MKFQFFSSTKPTSKKGSEVNINLAPKDPFSESLIGKISTWALSIGRYLVIFTELVVIMSFLSRFQLDRQVTDLNSEILQKQRAIESYGDLETEIRNLQKKIDTYYQLDSAPNFEEYFVKLSELTPRQVQYQSLVLNQNNLTITAIADTQNSLNQFLQNLQASQLFSSISSNAISSRDQQLQGYDVQIDAVFKTQAPAQKSSDQLNQTEVN